jgi:pimeloyl-[acyl-carrier protein] synthase
MGTDVELDPFGPEVRADPYPVYEEIRAADRVYWSAGQEAWLLTGYDDCIEVLRDPRSSNNSANAIRSGAPDDPLAGRFSGSRLMLFADPPTHTRLRGLVNKAFTPRRVEALRPHIQEIVDHLLDSVDPAGFDVIADLAFPLPVIVIAEMLGVPADDRDDLKRWSRDLARTIDPIVTAEAAEKAAMSGLMFINYLNNLIDERRRDPRDDLLSALIAAEEEGEHLTHEELLVNTVLVLIAGHETTQNLIGNGTLALFRNPDQRERFCTDPSVVKTAVEEVLRYDGPVQLTARHMLDDIEVGGRRIAKGQTAILLLAAANRDPEQFADPARFDVARDPNRHIAFGHGPHFCLGATLARAEGQAALSSLFRRFPDLQPLTDQPEYSDTFTLRGLASLPVRG